MSRHALTISREQKFAQGACIAVQRFQDEISLPAGVKEGGVAGWRRIPGCGPGRHPACCGRRGFGVSSALPVKRCAVGGDMRFLVGVCLLAAALCVRAETWIEVGADPEAKFYIDVDSIEVEPETIRLLKRGVYTHTLTENFGGDPAVFRETVGIVELDCRRRSNRVIKIDMIGIDGEVVWTSGLMRQQLWERVRTNTHAETTLDYVCARYRT
jgi:hypothetical protein